MSLWVPYQWSCHMSRPTAVSPRPGPYRGFICVCSFWLHSRTLTETRCLPVSRCHNQQTFTLSFVVTSQTKRNSMLLNRALFWNLFNQLINQSTIYFAGVSFAETVSVWQRIFAAKIFLIAYNYLKWRHSFTNTYSFLSTYFQFLLPNSNYKFLILFSHLHLIFFVGNFLYFVIVQP
jgi:hypothetical protein